MPQLFPNVFNLSALNGVNGFILNGVAPTDATNDVGISVGNAGDVNGDGVNDIIVGIDWVWPPGVNNPGSAFVVFGQKGDYSPVLELASLNGTQGFRINGIGNGDLTGLSVSGAGDVNGDGIDDVLVGAPFASPHNVTQAGSVFVVFGQRAPFPGELDLSDLTGSNGFRMNIFEFGRHLGNAVSSAGDFNGDGLDDILVGSAGYAWVVFGQRLGFPAVFELGQVDGHNGFELDTTVTYDYIGGSCGHADVNGDGLSDVIIGASGTSLNGRSQVGSGFVVFGSGSTFPAHFDVSTLNGSNGFWVNGVDSFNFAVSAVGSAGDFNGDGVEDFMLGAGAMLPHSYGAVSSTFVVYGRRTPFPAALELSALNGSNGFRVNGTAANDGLGGSLGAGDFNGDGLSDLLLGAAQIFSGQGMAVVVFGQRAAMVTPLELATLDGSNGFRLDGLALGDETGLSVSTAGDFNGDGIDDILMGAPEASPGGRGKAGVAYLVYGDRIEWLNNEAFFIHQNETLTLDTHHLNVSVPGRWDHLNFQVEGVTHGQFEYANQRGRAIEGFSYEDVSQRQVLFKHDGSNRAPQFGFMASHVLASSNASAVEVYFTGRPYLTRNHYEIYSQTWLLISNSSLAAYDPSTVLLPLLFKIENLSQGGFVNAQTKELVTQFTAEDINQAQIYFQPDNSTVVPPRFAVVVSNGVLSSEPQMAAVDYIVPTSTPTSAPVANSGSSPALRDGLIAGGVAAAAVLGLGLGWMYKRHKERNRQSERSLNRRLMEGNEEPAIEVGQPVCTSNPTYATFKV